MSINSVEISGNLTRDCETRQTPGGMTIHSFGVAVSERRQNPQTQEWEDKPNFVDCIMFDRNGTKQWMANAMRKGFKVFVRGKLSYSSWTDRDTGKNRSKLEVVVNDIDANWPPKQQGYAQQAPQAYPQQGYQQPQGYQQQPQGYAQPASAPQAPQPAAYPQQQQYAPQPAPQQVSAAPQQAPAPQQQPSAPQQAPQQQQMAMPQQQPAPVPDVYDEDIPF